MPKQDGTVGGRGFLIPGLGSYRKARGAAALAQKMQRQKRDDTASKEAPKPKLIKATRTKRKVLSQEKPAPAKSLGSKRYTRGSTDQALSAKPKKKGTLRKVMSARPKRSY